MSYILDALRRADAERDRGNVPSIHAQASFGASQPGRASSAVPPWAWGAGGALAVLLVGGVAWYVTRSSSPPVAAPAPIATAPSPAAPVYVPPPVAVAPAPPPVVAVPAPRPAVAAKVEPVRKPKAAASAAAEPASAGSGERIYAFAELPEDIRRQLPTLAVGGSMYSSKPADRLVILNGQVAHEGDKVGNDLVLQQIRLKSAVLNFRGTRYVINY